MISIAERRSQLADILRDRNLVAMLALGFSSGLPFLLVFSTQSVWLREAGVSLTEIGLFSYVALAFSFKFVWAPLIDALDVAGLSRWVGRRRAWMLIAQIGVALGLISLAFGNPSQTLYWSMISAFFVALAAATQDVAIDGWRIEAAPAERQGMMSATYQLGYRLAMLCAGAGALYIADFVSWKAAYLVMAGLMSIGIAACLLARPSNDRQARPAVPRMGFDRVSLRRTFLEPLADLFRRKGSLLIWILLLVAFYRLPDFVSGIMANPLYVSLGFSKTTIANISKIYGVWVGIAGAFGGGIAVSRLGLMPTLFCGGIAAPASHITLSYLAANGAQLHLLTLAISVESFASGFAGTALIAYMSSLTSPTFAATQYALLSSLYVLPGKFIGGLSGLMADTLGFPIFFLLTAAIGIPVVLLSSIVWRYSSEAAATENEADSAIIASKP